jgi:hypothetical protein
MSSLTFLLKRLGDLDQLLLADADLLDRGLGVLGQADAGHQLLGRLLVATQSMHAAARRLVAEEDVLGDGELGDQRQLLVDDDDARLLGGADVRNVHGLALEEDLAFVGAVRPHPGEHLHQGGLAGAVLAADGVDLAPRTVIVTSSSALTPGRSW